MNPISQSTVNAAIEALVESFSAVAPEGVQVLDGPRLSNEYTDRCVIFGYSNEYQPAVSVSREAPGGFQGNDSETLLITFLIGTTNGGTDSDSALRTARGTTTSLLHLLHQILTTDPTLGSVVGMAVLGPNEEWFQSATEEGIEVAMQGAIYVRSLL